MGQPVAADDQVVADRLHGGPGQLVRVEVRLVRVEGPVEDRLPKRVEALKPLVRRTGCPLSVGFEQIHAVLHMLLLLIRS